MELFFGCNRIRVVGGGRGGVESTFICVGKVDISGSAGSGRCIYSLFLSVLGGDGIAKLDVDGDNLGEGIFNIEGGETSFFFISKNGVGGMIGKCVFSNGSSFFLTFLGEGIFSFGGKVFLADEVLRMILMSIFSSKG